MFRNHYDVLGIPRDADPEAIRAAWKRLSRAHGAGASGDREAEEALKAVNAARSVLLSVRSRAHFDRELEEREGPVLDVPPASSLWPARRDAWLEAAGLDFATLPGPDAAAFRPVRFLAGREPARARATALAATLRGLLQSGTAPDPILLAAAMALVALHPTAFAVRRLLDTALTSSPVAGWFWLKTILSRRTIGGFARTVLTNRRLGERLVADAARCERAVHGVPELRRMLKVAEILKIAAIRNAARQRAMAEEDRKTAAKGTVKTAASAARNAAPLKPKPAGPKMGF